MGLVLSLAEGQRLLWSIPLQSQDWLEGERDTLKRELDTLDGELDVLCDICDFYSNKKRLQMVSHIVKDCGNSASFTDLLRVAVNPKYVSDLVSKASTAGLVIKEGRGYKVSEAGLGSFLLLSLATSRLLHALNSTSNYNKSFEEPRVNEKSQERSTEPRSMSRTLLPGGNIPLKDVE